jgi:hypothetical protein
MNQVGVVRNVQIFSPQGEAQHLYDGMYARGWFWRMRRILRRRPRQLLALSDIMETHVVTNRHDAGTQTVSISQIRGSENDSSHFDAGFYPLTNRTASRWLGIAEAWLRDMPLPPVELIQVGDRYFVRDGHHRISVARSLGLTHIDAAVVVWEVD